MKEVDSATGETRADERSRRLLSAFRIPLSTVVDQNFDAGPIASVNFLGDQEQRAATEGRATAALDRGSELLTPEPEASYEERLGSDIARSDAASSRRLRDAG